MVAKAGYVLYRGFIPPERILLLAFNKDAADELQQRVRDRLGPLGFDANAVVARTFHAFGLDIIGHATGRKPSLAPWLDSRKDPVLQLAMPSADRFAFGEERRLFSVALTRARRSIALFTIRDQASPFVVELISDHKLILQGTDGKVRKTRACPKCKETTLVKRKGPYSEFLGCLRYPRCDYKEKIPVKKT
jgi:superfamily I DNA/RNA helicase